MIMMSLQYQNYAVSSVCVLQKTIEHFEMLKVLGKGTFGKVVLCRDKETKQV